ncbi:acyl-CoA dehydrogenase [soil metagenome]
MNVAATFDALVRDGGLDVAVPGTGRTPERHVGLFEIARNDVAVARLAEAHVDAVTILREAGRAPVAGARYGVWAADTPGTTLDIDGDHARLSGTKSFCIGGGLLDRALITVRAGGSVVLVDVDVDPGQDTVRFDLDAWISPAFATTRTATTTFRSHRLDDDAVIGEPGWYLDRVGFWHGACGPAACWAGGAAGLVDDAIRRASSADDPLRDAQVGVLAALRWRMFAVLSQAGREIDNEPDDRSAAHRRALMVRHDVERAATEIIDRYGRLLGPRPLIFDADIVRRVAEVQVYVRQCHAERDLEALGRTVLDR